MKIEIHRELASVVRLGVIRLVDISTPIDSGDALWREVDEISSAIGRQYDGCTSGQVPGVKEARNLYRAVGIDPTKNRPSSEALLRRVLKKMDLYRIHPLVDAFNLASLSHLLPVGLYDESKVEGDLVTVRIGGQGWGFDGIRKARVNVEGRLCVTDVKGPFGSPTSDSLRTAIDGNVNRALAVFFQHRSGEADRLTRILDCAQDLAQRHLAAKVAERHILIEEIGAA